LSRSPDHCDDTDLDVEEFGESTLLFCLHCIRVVEWDMPICLKD
jgi:hypothetical protein